MGHTVRIIPAQFVKPYVKSNKNDMIDAAAIAEAVTRPTMRFVRAKTTEQAELQALHRVRDRLVSNKTQVINQVRAFCLEFGNALRKGACGIKLDLPQLLADETNDLTPRIRATIQTQLSEINELEIKIAQVTREIELIASQSEVA